MKKFAALFVFMIVIFFATTLYAQEGPVVLEAPGGSTNAFATGVNDQGQVIGIYLAGSEERAFFWDPVSGMQDIGSFGGRNTRAGGVNYHGQVTGWSRVSQSQHRNRLPHVFLWEPGGIMEDLGNPLGWSAHGMDINDEGQIIAYADAYNCGPYFAVLFDSNGTVGMGTKPARIPWAMNNAAQAVGYYFPSGRSGCGKIDTIIRAALWDAGNWDSSEMDLGTLGGLTSRAFDVNNHGQIVGQAQRTDKISRPVFWTQNTDGTYTIHELGTLGGPDGAVYGINDAGQMVGGSRDSAGAWNATLWDTNGSIVELGSFGATSHASAVNNKGQVAGYCYLPSGGRKPCVWNLVFDSDGDGIPDDEDACPDSDLAPTISVGGNDTGVENVLLEDGCTVFDKIEQIAATAKNHGQFVSAVAELANELKKAKVITGREKGRIQKAAAHASR